jgi:hypothetical protein
MNAERNERKLPCGAVGVNDERGKKREEEKVKERGKRKEKAEATEDAEFAEKRREEGPRCPIVRTHPSQKTRRMGHPQVHVIGGVSQEKLKRGIGGLAILARWGARLRRVLRACKGEEEGVRVGRGRRRCAGLRLCGRFRRGRGLAEWLRWLFAPGDRLREGS